MVIPSGYRVPPLGSGSIKNPVLVSVDGIPNTLVPIKESFYIIEPSPQVDPRQLSKGEYEEIMPGAVLVSLEAFKNAVAFRYILTVPVSTAFPASLSAETPLQGDFNRDNRIDASDLQILTSHWANMANGSTGDMDGDGVITEVDLARLALKWNQAPTEWKEYLMPFPQWGLAESQASLERLWKVSWTPTEGESYQVETSVDLKTWQPVEPVSRLDGSDSTVEFPMKSSPNLFCRITSSNPTVIETKGIAEMEKLMWSTEAGCEYKVQRWFDGRALEADGNWIEYTNNIFESELESYLFAPAQIDPANSAVYRVISKLREP